MQEAATMADDNYVSPHLIINNRLRSSVMAAQRDNRSIHKVHQRGFRPGKVHNFASFKPRVLVVGFLSIPRGTVNEQFSLNVLPRNSDFHPSC